MLNFNKLRKNVKAISPVISVLLMIAVAVVASLVAYAWVMGYIGFQTGNTGKAIQIQSIASNSTHVSVYVQNVGSGTVSFSAPCVYLNSTQATVASSIPSTPIAEGATVSFVCSKPGLLAGDELTVKVTTTSGTFSEVVKVIP